MKRDAGMVLALVGLGGLLWWLSRQQTPASDAGTSSDATNFTSDPIAAVSDAVQSSVSGWKATGEGPVWVPVLNAIEAQVGLPTDLLARIAYQESHFRSDIIRGVKTSSAGALGIMQMMPQYFASVRVPVPFTDSDVQAQMQEAANLLTSLYSQFGDWSLAIAAYNAGAGNVRKYGGIPPFSETQNYVTQILADLPALA